MMSAHFEFPAPSPPFDIDDVVEAGQIFLKKSFN
jgi:hypothetical protein